MYRINPLKRNVLITVDEVVFHAPTKQTLDPRTIEQHIIVAEERFIRPALGYDFYQALVVAKNKLVTSSNLTTLQTEINDSLTDDQQVVTLQEGQVINALEFLSTENKSLWNEHLWKLTAECVMLLAFPESFVQFGTEGVHHNAPPAGPMTSGGIVSPDLRTMKWAMDKKLMDRIDPLLESMHQWLCKQQDADSVKYPDYEKECDCNYEGIAYKRKTDIILGLYDDIDDLGCERC
jgi:hypothetical protein